MIKLYLSYFIYGFFIFYMNLFIWGFSAGPANILPYITLFSSVVLFSMASGLTLFYPKSASVLGLIGLAGTTSFEIYLIGGVAWSSKIFSTIILVSSVIYLVGLIYSIKNIIYYKKPIEAPLLKRYVRLILAFIPITLLLLWILVVFVRF